MDTRDLVRAMENIAPTSLAGSWDNVGLLAGDEDEELVGPVLCTIDLSQDVAQEAIDADAGAIVSYHPPIFSPIKRLVASPGRARALWTVVSEGMAIYSPHSALDAAPGGMADWLLGTCAPAGNELTDRASLEPHIAHRSGGDRKVAVFVPEAAAALVRGAMADAGAGVIGNYDSCSFASQGTGTFRGDDTTNPTVGQPEKLESAHELRMEMVCASPDLPAVVEALREAHPYEEPAFDIYELQASPDVRIGAGRVGTLAQPISGQALAQTVKHNLRVNSVRIAEPAGLSGRDVIERIAVCPGAGSSLMKAAAAAGAQAFVTGEMSHHAVLDGLELGLTVILAGHTNTERGYMPVLADRLSAALDSHKVLVSATDRWPLCEV